MIAPRFHIPVLLALAATLFFISLGGYDLWRPDEPRFAQVSREMLEGGDYLAPHVNGKPYTEKPPLFFWLTATLSALFGDVTETSARLVSAFSGVLTVVLTYLLARLLFGGQTAFWAGLVLLTIQRFWWEGRVGQLDMLLTVGLCGSFYCFWLWHTQRRPLQLFGFYACMAAAVLTKGPPGVLFPLLMVIAFYWKRKDARKGLHLLPGLLAVVLVLSLWLVPARMSIAVDAGTSAGQSITANVLRQTIGRFVFGVSHANPPWYYLVRLPVELLPWSLFLPWTLPWIWKNRRKDEEMRFLLSWVLPALVFFSICFGKRSVYLLPLFPAYAMLMARSLETLVQGEQIRWRRGIAVAWGTLLLVAGATCFALPLTEFSSLWGPGTVVMAIGLLAFAAHTYWHAFRSEARNFPAYVAAHFACVALYVSLLVLPALNDHKSARSFCTPLRQLADAEVEYSLYSFGFSHEEYIYYAKHPHIALFNDIIDIPQMEGINVFKQIRMQANMMQAIQESVEDVPIASLSNLSDIEATALHDAAIDNLSVSSTEAQFLPAYEAVVFDVLDHLCDSLNLDTPCFIIVREKDWRWVLAFRPEARDYHIAGTRPGDGKDVLLIANAAGARALAFRE